MLVLQSSSLVYFRYAITRIKKRRKAGQCVRYEKEQGGFKSQEEQVQVPGRHASPRLPGRQSVGEGQVPGGGRRPEMPASLSVVGR